MGDEKEIDGAQLVRWIARDEVSRVPRLLDSGFADDHHEWRVVATAGPMVTLTCDTAPPKTVHYRGLKDGSLYVSVDSGIWDDVQSERSDLERRVEAARAMLNERRLVGGVRPADTEAVRLYDIVNPWFSDRRLPSLDQVREARGYFERATPVTTQACDLMRDWLSACMSSTCMNSAARSADEIGFRIQCAALLRAARRPEEALVVTDVLLDARGWPWGEQARAILLTVRAGALMDLFERNREIEGAQGARKWLAEARRRLGNAYAIQGPNEHVSAAYRRLDSLEKSLRGN